MESLVESENIRESSSSSSSSIDTASVISSSNKEAPCTCCICCQTGCCCSPRSSSFCSNSSITMKRKSSGFRRGLRVCFSWIDRKYFAVLDYLFTNCDPGPLALFRILFGFLMILDVPQERGLEDADIRFGDPNYCFFPLFDWLQPVSVQNACILYSLMWAGAFGMMIGLKFRCSCYLYLGPYLYFFLLDKSRWNNHSYLFALFTLLLSFSGAGENWSLDAVLKPVHEKSYEVPRWNYFLLKFQIFILYFYAGVKKLDADWISGYSMKNLSKHKVFAPIKLLLEPDVIEYYMIHMGGLVYDLTVGFMLNFEISKKLGVFLSVAFHGLNSQVFDIGMFPYVCLASLILFFKPDQFPCSILKSSIPDQHPRTSTKRQKTPTKVRPQPKINHLKTVLFGSYILIQLVMPFSHFVTQGYNNWTAGLYGYSWDMMVNSWETLHQKVTVKNRFTGQERYLDPDVWVANDRWSSHADMAIQYANCVARNLGRFNITDIEVNLDVWKSLNGRFQQRIYDPRVDILTAPWSPTTPVAWLLPLLKDYSHYRKEFFEKVAQDVANWTTASDVIFVADFPGLYLENYLPKELTNITVTLLSGQIIVEQPGQENVTLSSWEVGGTMSQTVFHGQFHKIHTISNPNPSCYMYTYTNSTQDAYNLKEKQKEEEGSESNDDYFLMTLAHTFYDFVLDKVDVFSRSMYLVVNAHLNLLFDVPMVLRKSV